jgi:hypothetical protein
VRVLVEAGEPGLTARRRYDPLAQNPALFRAFAEVPPTEDGILAFANEWGALGEADRIVGETPLATRPAELLLTWVRAISEMRQAVWVWNKLTSKSRDEQRELLRRVRWERAEEGNTSVLYDSHPHLSPRQAVSDDGYARVATVIASSLPGDESLAQFQEGEVATPARHFLCRLANRNLLGRVSPRLVPDEGLVMGSLLSVMASLRWQPANLFACLWLQFARIMSSDKEQRVCPGCGRWFEVKAKGTRSDRRYCSDPCRKRVHREKRERARRLHAAGRKVKDIARELETDVGQVKKWVAGTKG